MFKCIYLFEMKTAINKKSFKISLLIFSAIIFLLTFIPRIASSDFFHSASKKIKSTAAETDDPDTALIYAIYIEDPDIDETLLTEYTELRHDGGVIVSSKDDLIEHLKDKIVKYALYIKNLDEIEIITDTLSMYESSIKDEVKRAVLTYKEMEFLNDNNISSDDFYAATDTSNIKIETTALNKNETASYPIAYIALVFMYIMIISYAQYTSMAVAREKNDRTMELLITSADAEHLILGKVLASCTTAVLQVILIIFVGFLGVTVNKDYYPLFLTDIIKENLNPLTIAIFLSFFILGYIMYNIIFAAIGALVERMEDINSVAQPIILVVVLIFFAGMTSINLPNPTLNNILAVIPLSSPMVILSAVIMRGMSLYLVGLSFILLLLTTILLCYIAAKIYRLGSLSYGNKIGLFKAVKLIFSKN